MGTSEVEFRGQSFWTRDSALRAALALLVVELDPLTSAEPELDSSLNRWAMSAALGVTGAVDAALDHSIDHTVELIQAAIPRVKDRLADKAVVEVVDPAFLRRAALTGAPTDDPPAVLGAWAREVLSALDQLLAGKLPDVQGGYWWVDDNGLNPTHRRGS